MSRLPRSDILVTKCSCTLEGVFAIHLVTLQNIRSTLHFQGFELSLEDHAPSEHWE